MAREIMLGSLELKAVLSVKPWLVSDSEKRGSNIRFVAGSAYRTANALYEKAIPKYWEQYQTLDKISHKDELLKLRTGRQVLECMTLARRAYILGKVARRADAFEAQQASWRGLDKYLDSVKSKQTALPAQVLLDLPINEAVKSYIQRDDAYKDPTHTYIGIVGLGIRALSGLSDTMHPRSDLVLAVPGREVDDVERWDFKPNIAPNRQR